MKKISLAFLFLIAISCTVNKPQQVGNLDAIIAEYTQIAVLPMSVRFSEDFKRMPNRGRNSDWDEQERLAGLDLQKICFVAVSDRANKKNWSLTAQNYLLSNKTLAERRVAIKDIPLASKDALAKLLKVDAVLYGTSTMDFNMNSYRKGMETELQLIDAKTGQVVWSHSYFESISNRMESPQDLAEKSMNSLVKMLPIKAL